MDEIVKVFGRTDEGDWQIYELEAEDTAKASRKANLRGADLHAVKKPNIDPDQKLHILFEEEVCEVEIPPSLVLLDGKGTMQLYFVLVKPEEDGQAVLKLKEAEKINPVAQK